LTFAITHCSFTFVDFWDALIREVFVKLGGRQLAVMRVLWDRGEATVAEAQELLDLERPLAYSTVATVLSRMEQKGLVTHRAEGRVFYYRPAVSEDGMGTSLVGELVDQIFGGSPSALVSHLLDSEQVDPGELDRIKRLVSKHEKRNPKKKGGSK
jgi:predicted transcriptional regulator